MDKNVPGEFVLEKSQVRAAFERSVATYDDSAVLQREIADRLLERLDLIQLKPQMILDVGCGTGYCGRLLKKRYRRARVIGIDIATGMVRRAQEKAGWFSRRGFICGDAESMPVRDKSVDMIISNLTLQWCRPDKVFSEFVRVLRPGGVLMFTSFGPDTLYQLRDAWRAVDDRPHVHGFIDMHDLGDALIQAGFADPVMDAETLTLTYGDVIEVLRDLKNIGAHNIAHGRRRGLTGKKQFLQFRSAYQAQARNGRVEASFEAVYGHAWAPEGGSQRRSDGGATIPLNRIGRPPR